MNATKAYRIVEMKNNQPHTLFHGLPNGNKRSREIPTDVWIRAEVKPVSYGRTSPFFDSGFNVILSKEECEAYLQRFTADRTLKVVEVFVKNLRLKPHATSPVYLAEWMMLPKQSING